MPFQEYLTRLEQASLRTTLDNLMTFPCVRILAERGKLQLHAAYFGVATGGLSVMDKTNGEFHRVAAAEHRETFSAARF